MMKYVALAEQAEFTMLQRYIPALRSVTTAEEKAAILRETAAKGFQVARAEAMTFSGVLEQLKNVAGDAMEQVGGGIASVLHGPMNQLKNWIIENEKMFIQWGRVIGSVIRSAFSYIKQLYDIVRDSGWSDALSKLGADIKEALKISIDYIKPYAKEIGAAIADGLKNSVASIDWGKIIGKFILGTPRRVKTVFDMIGGTAVEGGMAAKDYLADMAKSMFNVEKEMKKLNGGV
jgi:hypothetical protein